MQRWYAAVLVISSKVAGQASASPALDLQYRVVRAANMKMHTSALSPWVDKEAHPYANADGETVTWECLHDLREIDDVELIDARRCAAK